MGIAFGIVIALLFIGVTFACVKHYDYCNKIQYLEDNGYVKHKHTVGYDGRYILYFTKGVTKVDEEELFKLFKFSCFYNANSCFFHVNLMRKTDEGGFSCVCR